MHWPATLATSALAAEESILGAWLPAPSTVQGVTAFIDSYAGRSLANFADLVVYPTATRSDVFVSIQTDGASAQKEHVGLAHVEGGRVVRFTDFSGSQPRQMRSVAAVDREDA